MYVDTKEKGEKTMLNNKEMFESMKSMGLNVENMEQFKGMLNNNETSLCKFKKIKVVFECGSVCDAVEGILVYVGQLKGESKEVLVLAIPFCKCCKICYKICIINLDKVVSVNFIIC